MLRVGNDVFCLCQRDPAEKVNIMQRSEGDEGIRNMLCWWRGGIPDRIASAEIILG